MWGLRGGGCRMGNKGWGMQVGGSKGQKGREGGERERNEVNLTRARPAVITDSQQIVCQWGARLQIIRLSRDTHLLQSNQREMRI